MGEPVVHARGLVKRFGDLVAVDGIDLDVPRGVCFGILGPNGAGKSTTLRMTYAASPRTGGDLRVFGLDVAQAPREIKARLGVLAQEDNLDGDLRVMENLYVFARYYGVRRADARARAEELLEFFALRDRAGVQVAELSGGMRRRLAIARALMNQPDLLILDEPTSGLDPQARHLIWQRLRALKARGATMILTTHYMEEAAQLCDRLVIMDRGRILTEGSPAEVVARHVPPSVVEVRLPHDAAGAAARIEGAAHDAGARMHEVAGDTLFLYGDDGEAMARAVGERFALPYVRRPANLEDVFLRLAGRELRENA